ncbi:MAG TPA: type II secretion system minor pseudopilin GspI [Steroidobacteraceae bacterium]|nr:type II secretion system minor pseudopilin GspI [Steroidobacteraceae bacterium]
MRIPRRKTGRGFTLIEVLIALAVVALAVGALLGTITSAASNISYLRDKTLAEWVALNRLAEIRISQQMPDVGKRTGNTVMAGMRWQWEQEVIELPVKGMFRVDVRSRPTGETVDDTRAVEQQQTAQKDPESSPSGGELEKANWSTTVTGVVSSARSDRNTAIGMTMRGNITGAPNNQGPGGPGTPAAPGTTGSPGNPGNPGNPSVPVKPPPTDR